MISQFFSGCIFLGFLVVAGHFLKFWRSTGDRFFLFFAIAFTMFGLERICVGLFIGVATISYIYLLRLIGTCLIIAAIIDKNRT